MHMMHMEIFYTDCIIFYPSSLASESNAKISLGVSQPCIYQDNQYTTLYKYAQNLHTPKKGFAFRWKQIPFGLSAISNILIWRGLLIPRIHVYTRLNLQVLNYNHNYLWDKSDAKI